MKRAYPWREPGQAASFTWMRPLPLLPEFILALLLGAIHSQAFAWRDAWWLQLLVLAVLAARVRVAGKPRQGFVIGLGFGTSWIGAATWWMFVSLHQYGGLPAWMAVLAVALLSVVLSLYLAAALALHVARRPAGPWGEAVVFAACWLLAELARGVIFTGFPWAASGYAHTSGPLAVLAPFVGVYGIGFVAAGLAALAARALAGDVSRRSVGALAAAAVLAVLLALARPPAFSSPNGELSLTLLQTNVPQDEKFSMAHVPEELQWLGEQLLAARGDLVVAPETAIPLLPEQLAPEYWQAIVEHFQQSRQAALIGLPLGNADVGYTNSVAGISAATRQFAAPGSTGFYRYDKHHLVPFGEFIPAGFRWFVDLMNIPLGDFNRGPLSAPPFIVGSQRIGPNICYEDLFGEELAVRFADPAQAPTVFVNVSNIAWFGDTVALHQHEEISRMRTLEFQRPMVRATNTGVTVVIDHEGHATARLPTYTREVLQASVQGRTGLTPYARWASHAGLWPLVVLAALVLGWPRRATA